MYVCVYIYIHMWVNSRTTAGALTKRERGWRRVAKSCGNVIDTAGRGSSSLAYRAVHWRKLKPAKHSLSLSHSQLEVAEAADTVGVAAADTVGLEEENAATVLGARVRGQNARKEVRGPFVFPYIYICVFMYLYVYI